MQQQISPWSIYDRQFSLKKQREPFKIALRTPRQKPSQKSAFLQERKRQQFYTETSMMNYQTALDKIIVLRIIRAALGQVQAEGEAPCLPPLKGNLPIKRHLSNSHHNRVKDRAIRFRGTQQAEVIPQMQQDKSTARAVVFDYDPFSDEKFTQRKRLGKRDDSKFKFQTGIQFEMIKF